MTYMNLLIQVLNSSQLSEADKTAFQNLLNKGLQQQESNYDLHNPDEELKGRLDYQYICSHYPQDVFVKLDEPTDFASLYLREVNEKAKEAKRIKRKRWTIVGCVAAVLVIFISIYNLPYFSEKRAYSRTLKELSGTYALDEYIRGYEEYGHPDHLPDVYFRKAMIELSSVGSDSPERDCIESLTALTERFPQHSLAVKANQTIDSIWNAEVERFTSINPDYEKNPGMKMMFDLLSDMRANRIYDIALDIESDVKLKDYSEFDELVRTLIELDDKNLKDKGVLPVKEHFTKDRLDKFESILINGFKESFNKIFSPNFFNIKLRKTSEEIAKNAPVLKLKYLINTQTEKIGDFEIPTIWVHKAMSTGQYNFGYIEDYILGISVFFDAQIQCAGKEPWQFSEEGHPENEIRDIENINDGYRIMVERSFEQFRDKLHRNIGLYTESDSTEIV